MEHNIASLNLPQSVITKMKEKGYNYLSDINPDLIKEKLGIDLDITSTKQTPETKTALEIYSEELLNDCVLTYNEKLDLVLRDVILPKTITELTGGPGCGKTQVCFQLCISVQLPKWCGGIEGEAVYIDTNSNFASHRITELAKSFTEKYNSIKPSTSVPYKTFDNITILQHIHYTKVCDILELLACISHLKNYLQDKNVRLLIIDSFSFIMRMVEANDRKTIICKIFRDLRSLARTHNFGVVITNDLTTRVNKGESYTTPSFGNSFYHLVNTRILLSKEGEAFHAKLEKTIIHGQKETTFYL